MNYITIITFLSNTINNKFHVFNSFYFITINNTYIIFINNYFRINHKYILTEFRENPIENYSAKEIKPVKNNEEPDIKVN